MIPDFLNLCFYQDLSNYMLLFLLVVLDNDGETFCSFKTNEQTNKKQNKETYNQNKQAKKKQIKKEIGAQNSNF